MSSIHIVSAFDDAYAPHFATLASSIAATKGREVIRFTVLCDSSLSPGPREKLYCYLKSLHFDLDLRPVAQDLIAQLPPTTSYPPPMWYRLLLPDMLNDDLVLYLDADTLVLHNLAPLFSMELGTNMLAAVAAPTFGGRTHMQALGMNPASEYFYSGMLIMNLARMRADNFSSRAISIAKDKLAVLKFPDQDVLNLAVAGRWMKLEPKWHATSFLWQDHRMRDNTYSRLEYAMATVSPAIVHFEGPKSTKPWHVRSAHPMREVYRQFREQTPWSDYKLEGRPYVAMLLRRLPLKWQYRISSLKNTFLRALRIK